MADAQFEITGLQPFIDAIKGVQERASVATKALVNDAAHAIEAQAKMNASGRPGPEVQTGTLRRSIHVVGPEKISATGWQAQVGPSVLYGRRVELGFSGTDSRGHSYDGSAKYPYLVPAYETIAAYFPGRWEQAMRKALLG